MKYFGTDGIRGKPNQKLTVDFALALGKSLRLLDCKSVLIGTDTRISKDMLASAVTAGCLSVGLNVYDLGVISTPAILYLTEKHQMIGVMITASHNPYEDNGIKLMNKGAKITNVEEKKIEESLYEDVLYPKELGKYFWCPEKKEEYLQFLKCNISKTNLKIVIDCANGATSEIAPILFKEVTENLIVLSCTPNGFNINRDCGSTHLSSLRQTVLDNKYDIGFAFDGDGDRVLCVAKDGQIIDGDHIIYLLARYLKNKKLLCNDTIALTIMSDLGLIRDLESRGIHTIETPVGDKHILQAIEKYRLSVGGENSGHIIYKNLFSSGDGVLISLLILKILVETKTSIQDWFVNIPTYYSRLVNIKTENRECILHNPLIDNKIKEFKMKLQGDCKIIIRASGTEEVIRVMGMAQNQQDVDDFLDNLLLVIEKIKNKNMDNSLK